jgi:hypothetical protein
MRMGFFRALLLTVAGALNVLGQSAQPFDVAIGGADGWCVLVTPSPIWQVQFPGISNGDSADVKFLAAGGSGRVLGLDRRGSAVVEVRPDLTTVPVFAGVPGRGAEELVADSAGNLYINTGEFLGEEVIAVRADGTIRARFSLLATSIDLAADQCTLFYAMPRDLSDGVRRLNVCTGAPLPDFIATGGGFVKILPDGGVLTATPDFSRIARHDAAGALVRTYDILHARVLALGRAGTTFFAAQGCDSTVREYDLATGALLRTITADMDHVVSVVAYNGFTAALGPTAAAHAATVPALSTTMLAVLGALLALLAVRRLM